MTVLDKCPDRYGMTKIQWTSTQINLVEMYYNTSKSRGQGQSPLVGTKDPGDSKDLRAHLVYRSPCTIPTTRNHPAYSSALSVTKNSWLFETVFSTLLGQLRLERACFPVLFTVDPGSPLWSNILNMGTGSSTGSLSNIWWRFSCLSKGLILDTT